MAKYQYDVALSYASEQRDTVRRVKKILEEDGLRVFYDETREEELVSQDLYSKLYHVFRYESRYTAAFVSADYLRKDWTMEEADAAMFHSRDAGHNCVIPVCFGGADLDKLDPDIHRIHADGETPVWIADKIRHAVPAAPKKRTLLRRAALLVLCVLLAITAVRGVVHWIQDAWEGAPVEIDAEALDAGTLYEKGEDYYYGRGVEQDYAKAREYWEQAAALGNTSAIYSLGYLYQHGQGVEVDYAKARDYYEQAAALGNSAAINSLGYLYDHGYGVEQDYAKARDYFEQAAAKGNATAIGNLGLLYEFGHGVDVDYGVALYYYQHAANLGSEKAKTYLARLQEKMAS